MTSIHIYDPSDGAALPELPPLPIGVLAVGTADLLQQAADLPQPRYIFIYVHGQAVELPVRPGAGERAGHHPLGAAVRQRRDQRAPPGHRTAPRPGTGPTSTTSASPSRRMPTSRPHRPAD